MNYSKYRFNLDMQSYISQISLPVRQHDTGIVLRINLTDGGVPYVIRDGCRAVFYARKSDGNPLMNDCIIEKNTTICYELTQQTTSCSGVVDCEVRLYGSDGNLITTPRFILVIDSRVVHDEDFPLSEAEQTVLDNIILSEQKRQKNELEREKTYNEMLETTEEASSLAATLRQKLDTGDYDGITPHIGANGNWWFDDEDTGILASGYTIPLRVGEGSHSLEQQDEAKSNKAATENSIALGEGSIAGAKGYYFTEIFYGKASINPQIKVSAVQPVESGLYISPEALSSNPTFEAPNYAVGDVFSLICNDHFILFGTITDISHDIISFKGDLEVFKSRLESMVSQGSGKMAGDYYINLVPQYDDYTLCVPNKPLNGIVEVCKNAFASGYGNISAGEEGTAHGASTKVVGAYGHTSGIGTLAGYASSAEGSGSQALAKYSHAQNMNTKATGLASHAEGLGTTSSGQFSHSEGTSTTAKGDASHAEGRSTQSLGNGTHSEGGYTTAQGAFSHAEGASTLAKGTASHAGGYHTIASADYQTAIGMYNKQNPNALFVVGNGTSDTERSNALEVLKDGSCNIPGIAKLSTGTATEVNVGSASSVGGYIYELEINFGFVPKLVLISDSSNSLNTIILNVSGNKCFIVNSIGQSTSTAFDGFVTTDNDNSVAIYRRTNSYDTSGAVKTYSYVAIG